MSTSTRSSASMPPSPGLRTTDPASSTSPGWRVSPVPNSRRFLPCAGPSTPTGPVGGIACSRTGAFATPGWPGPPAAPGPALPRAARNALLAGAVSLLLNSGRLRDQWHTMTCTGHVPWLQEAEPLAQGADGAASLLALGVKEGIWCAFATGLGGAAAGGAG